MKMLAYLMGFVNDRGCRVGEAKWRRERGDGMVNTQNVRRIRQLVLAMQAQSLKGCDSDQTYQAMIGVSYIVEVTAALINEHYGVIMVVMNVILVVYIIRFGQWSVELRVRSSPSAVVERKSSSSSTTTRGLELAYDENDDDEHIHDVNDHNEGDYDADDYNESGHVEAAGVDSHAEEVVTVPRRGRQNVLSVPTEVSINAANVVRSLDNRAGGYGATTQGRRTW